MQPGWWFYVLAVVAFLGWSIGTSPTTANLFHLDSVSAGFILAATAFIVPLLDKLIARLSDSGA